MYLMSFSNRWLFLLIPALFILLSLMLTPAPKDRQADQHYYPWTISIDAEGHSQVFGLTLGVSTWVETSKQFNRFGDLAVFDDGHDKQSLEGYLGDVTVAGLSGKMIARLAADPALIQKLIDGARKREVQKSGAIRYSMDLAQRREINPLTMVALTFIPVVDLEPEVIIKRFGAPDRILVMPNGLRHFVYPKKGLDIIVDEHGKEILQYVLPADIQGLLQPLIDQGGKDE